MTVPDNKPSTAAKASTPNSTNNSGEININVGFAPLRPAEFVDVGLDQIEPGSKPHSIPQDTTDARRHKP